MKVLVRPAAGASGTLNAIDAASRAARAPAHYRGIPGSPADWPGTGSQASGWTLPSGVLYEYGGARVAIVATDAFAAATPQFSNADDALPADWAEPDDLTAQPGVGIMHG